MTSYLIDINVWLALAWRGHSLAGIAAAWIESLPQTRPRLLFCRMTQLGLLRLLANERVMGASVLNIGAALAAFDRLMEDPRVEVLAEPQGLDRTFRQTLSAFRGQPATKAVADAHLAAFAEAGNASLVTFDKALSANARRRGLPCVLLRPH